MTNEETKTYIYNLIYKKVMVDKVISQSELAAKLGIAKSAVNNWFSRKSIPSGELMYKIAEILNIDLYALYGKENPYKLSEQDKDNLKFCREYQDNVDSMKNALGWKK